VSKLTTRGLYAITDAILIPDQQLPAAVEQAVQGGARLLQYRDKSSDVVRRLHQARILHSLCQRYGIPLIINDDVELATRVGAAGVHLGRQDPAFATARTRLGESAIIGVSCYNQLELALTAAREGADYVAFGSFFLSPTKTDTVRATIDLLRQAKQVMPLPIVAIGGITPTNGKPLVAAGADYLAVINGVFGQPDIRSAARSYSLLYEDFFS
jgi:thiamine-phosphate pyrophosphorylase